MNRYAWIADIKKAFLNIALQPTDEAIRFLWSTEPSKIGSPLIVLKWKRVPFGLSSSPFLLRATVNKHLKSVRSRFPGTVDQLMEQLYAPVKKLHVILISDGSPIRLLSSPISAALRYS
jgi:hypothetical protein